MTGPSVHPLEPGDAPALAALLRAQRDAYMAHFGPFAFDPPVIVKALREARRDRYWRLDLDGRMVGFAMMRGLDQGFARPSFGVFVAEHAKGRGVARAALAHALDWAAAQGDIAHVMLKVAPENRRAWRLYRTTGFRALHIDEATGQLVMQYDLLREPGRPG